MTKVEDEKEACQDHNLEETELGFEPRPFPHYIQQLCSHPWLTQKPRPNRHSAPENMGKAVPEQSKNLPSRIGRRCDDSGAPSLEDCALEHATHWKAESLARIPCLSPYMVAGLCAPQGVHTLPRSLNWDSPVETQSQGALTAESN